MPKRNNKKYLNRKMSAKKFLIKARDRGDDLEDPEFSISPCLQVSPDVQLQEVPTTGEEYLLSVMKEREKYAATITSTVDYSKYAKNQSYFVKEIPRPDVPAKLKPTIEWQNLQVAEFSDVRMYISRMLTKKHLWPCNLKKIEIEQNTSKGWKTFFTKCEPTLTCVLGLNYTLLDCGLEILTEMLNEITPGDSINQKTGQWIYALLACTRQPLLSETISVLRNLARKCAEIRSHINQDDEDSLSAVAPLNIFICLVARYFGQHDLAD